MTRGKVFLQSYYLLGFVLVCASCFPKERRLHFNKNKLEISLCEKGEISRVKIYGRIRGSDVEMNKIADIAALANGVQSFSLMKYNAGYDSIIGIRDLSPNYEYRINIPHLDNQSEITFYTDSLSRIDSVENDFDCKGK